MTATWIAPAGGREKARAATTLKALPAEERPRERLFVLGEEALADSELLGILIGSGTRGATAVELGRRLVARYGGLRGLGRVAAAELAALEGIGPARAARLRACAEIARRVAAAPLEVGIELGGPEAVHEHFGPLLRDLDRERFYLVLLDGRNRILKPVLVAEGTLTEAVVHPREAFAPAIIERAASAIAVHNHPSGDPEPSADDLVLTERLEECGRWLGIPLLDHVIVGGRGYVSLRERGCMRPPPDP